MMIFPFVILALSYVTDGDENQERFGRVGEVPDRLLEIMRRHKSSTKMPQSLAGVRGVSATPLHFGEIKG
jgi:hypothetical protein